MKDVSFVLAKSGSTFDAGILAMGIFGKQAPDIRPRTISDAEMGLIALRQMS